MPQFYTLPTAIGEAKIANAIALGGTVEITKLAIGDGGGSLPTPDSDRTSLVNEIRRAAINTSVVDDDNPNWIVVEQVLPPDIGGWTIREVGLYDADGDLIAYGNYPETYKPVLSEGSGRTQTIRFVMQVSDTAAVTLKVDPSVVLATRQLVDDKVAEHAQSRNHPDATTTAKGFMQFGTSEETRQGSRTDRAAHLAGVKAAIDQHKSEAQAHAASKISLDTALATFGGANTVQAVLALLGAAAKAANHNDITGRSDADAHPMSAITGLNAAISAINQTLNGLGAAAQAENHNGLAGRDSSDAHPMSAITGLNAAISAINQTLNGLGGAATRDVGTNPGNVLEFAAFGLGDPIRLDDTDDLNEITKFGLYGWGGPTPQNAPSAYSVMLVAWDSQQPFQIVFSGTNSHQIYSRRRNNDSYADYWNRFDNSENPDFGNIPTINGGPMPIIGVGQSWQDVTSSRSEGVTYTNSTGKPIMWAFSKNNTDPLDFIIDGVVIATLQDGAGDPRSELSAIVPDGSTYKVSGTTGGEFFWTELR